MFLQEIGSRRFIRHAYMRFARRRSPRLFWGLGRGRRGQSWRLQQDFFQSLKCLKLAGRSGTLESSSISGDRPSRAWKMPGRRSQTQCLRDAVRVAGLDRGSPTGRKGLKEEKKLGDLWQKIFSF